MHWWFLYFEGMNLRRFSRGPFSSERAGRASCQRSGDCGDLIGNTLNNAPLIK
jgi:hypothetical protein